MCQLNECAQPPCQCLPLQTSEMGETHVYFIRSMASTHRSEPTELQICMNNSASGLSQNCKQEKDVCIMQRKTSSDLEVTFVTEYCKEVLPARV